MRACPRRPRHNRANSPLSSLPPSVRSLSVLVLITQARPCRPRHHRASSQRGASPRCASSLQRAPPSWDHGDKLASSRQWREASWEREAGAMNKGGRQHKSEEGGGRRRRRRREAKEVADARNFISSTFPSDLGRNILGEKISNFYSFIFF